MGPTDTRINMRKRLVFTAIFVFVSLVVFSYHSSVRAGINDNVMGWAWSSNIGWISFNSTNPPGTSLSFNESGGGGSGEYVYVPGVNFGLSQTTVEAWIRPEIAADQRAPIVRMDNFYFQVFENNRLAAYWYGKSPAGYHYSNLNSISMGEWTHVAVVWDGSGVRFYINGELDSPVSTSGTGNSTNWVNIGQENASRRYNGMIDDVRIWSVVRTEQEIRESMTSSLSGNETGLVGYWKFNEGSGGTAFDSSPSNNNGSIQGASWVTYPDFGVNIGLDGNITGYAWSSNIGWISFNPAGPYPQAPNYSGTVDIYGDLSGCGERGWICGWARACSVFQSGCSGLMIPASERGGWDGWIFLGPHGSPADGVRLNDVGTHFDLRGYAWADEPIGWINFSCIDDGNCSQNPFNVKTTYLLNSPPEVTFSNSTLDYCAYETPPAATGLTVALNWGYFDRDGDSQDRYEIHVSEDPNFVDRFEWIGFSSVEPGETGGYLFDPTQDPNWQNELDWNTTYYWRIRVHDGNFWSQDWYVNNFTVVRTQPSPLVAFSWLPEQVSVGEIVTFIAEDDENVSQVHDGSTPFYEWTFDKGELEPEVVTSSSTATTTFEQQGSWSAKLEITDGAGYSCSLEKSLDIRVPLPDWREVTPFGRAKMMLSGIIERIFGS